MYVGRADESRKELLALRPQVPKENTPMVDMFLAEERGLAGDVVTARPHYQAALASKDADLRTRVFSRILAAGVELAGGQTALARRFLDETKRDLTDPNARVFEPMVQSLQGEAALADGKLRDAESLARKAIAGADTIGIRDTRIAARMVLAAALERDGKTAEADAVYEELDKLGPESDNFYLVLRLRTAAAVRAKDTRSLDAIAADARTADLPGIAAEVDAERGLLEVATPATAEAGKARLQESLKTLRPLGREPIIKRINAALGS
jgi:hypothetical protein